MDAPNAFSVLYVIGQFVHMFPLVFNYGLWLTVMSVKRSYGSNLNLLRQRVHKKLIHVSAFIQFLTCVLLDELTSHSTGCSVSMIVILSL